jgi:hypothetical protein
VALEDDGKRGTVAGGDGEVAAMVELSRCAAGQSPQMGPPDAFAQHPNDVSVAMVVVISNLHRAESHLSTCSFSATSRRSADRELEGDQLKGAALSWRGLSALSRFD